MPIDAGIYSQVQQPAQPNLLATLAQAYQIKGLQSGIAKADRDEERQNRLYSVLQSPEFQNGDVATKQRLAYGAGDVEAASKIGTASAAANKDQREADKTELSMAIDRYQASSGAFAEIAKNPASAPQIMNTLVQAKIIAPEYAQKVLTSAAQAPDPTQFWMQGASAAISAKDKLTAQIQQQAQAVTMRGQDMTQQTALATNANTVGVQRDRLDFDKNQPKGQVVQTENGPMMVDTRTGEAKPITVGGVPVQKPGKDIPPNINKSIIENQQNISKIDNAMAAIKAKPGSLGPQYLIPGAETVGQFMDPEGVNARAGVADIGSLILHDRSGAAVTASETPRLKPFIPSAADSPDVALKKLRRFKEIYAQEADLLSQTYSKDQGYKESPLLKGGAAKPATAAAPGVISVTNAADYAKVPSGATYTTPDGKMRRKP